MSREWKGSITVEASYLVPMTLVIYGVIILVAATLLVRCLSSQNGFLLNYQRELYTNYEEAEVIYGK